MQPEGVGGRGVELVRKGKRACVAHDDGKNYCFRLCSTKEECNANRDAANEANCSSSITFVEGKTSSKACVPPSAS